MTLIDNTVQLFGRLIWNKLVQCCTSCAMYRPATESCVIVQNNTMSRANGVVSCAIKYNECCNKINVSFRFIAGYCRAISAGSLVYCT